MKTPKWIPLVKLPGIVAALVAASAQLAGASTIWNGPTVNFTHSSGTGELADHITTGVILTRGTSGGGLYNSATESGASSGISPSDTKWAVGSLANYASLSYGACPLEAGNHPPGDLNKTYVVHLVNEDIYLSLTLTAWGGAGGVGDKSFSYTRSTAAAPTPTVAISSPASGAVFAAPASISIAATASVSSGTVTNVQFFTNNFLLGSVLTAPYSITASSLPAGAYALKAVAIAAGVSATSTVVNITVVPPPAVSITSPASGAVFAAPASVSIAASASVSGGTVTNVQFFTNGISAGSVLIAPFSITANNLAAGACALKAVATASGISTTSSVVNVSVVNPVAVTLSGTSFSGGLLSFNYAANAGLSYVVQSSTNLMNWTALTTNTAAGASVLFTDPSSATAAKFYRVGRLPNP